MLLLLKLLQRQLRLCAQSLQNPAVTFLFFILGIDGKETVKGYPGS